MSIPLTVMLGRLAVIPVPSYLNGGRSRLEVTALNTIKVEAILSPIIPLPVVSHVLFGSGLVDMFANVFGFFCS